MVPVLRKRTQQRTLKDTGREPGIMESRRKEFFLEGGVININKCKHKVKMTQTQMCLLYSATYGIRSGLIKMDRTEVKFKSLGINGK